MKSRVCNLLLIATLVVGLLGSGCFGGRGTGGQSELLTETDGGGISLGLLLTDLEYEVSDRIYVSVRVRNISGAAINYNAGISPIYAVVSSADADMQVYIGEKGEKYSKEDAEKNTGARILAAGDSIVLVTYWDQRFLDEYGNNLLAPTGDYEITALFTPLPDVVISKTVTVSSTAETTNAQTGSWYAEEVHQFSPGEFEEDYEPSTGADGAKALGAPDDEYVKLGLDGIIVLQFGDNMVLNGPGYDIRINMFPSESEFDETDNEAELWASTSGNVFLRLPVTLGNGGKSYNIDLSWSAMPAIQSLKIIDTTDHSILDEGYGGDGFSVESIVVNWSR